MIYYDKLKAFCEGLEMENIETLMTKSPEFFNALGKTMANQIKERTPNYRTTTVMRFRLRFTQMLRNAKAFLLSHFA